MSTAVDELCRSYLDLKYHFDPAAGSMAGLVAQDGRLGRFDSESVQAHVAALRSVSGAVEELEVDDLTEEVDRTALLGEMRSAIHKLEHERPHQRNPVFWVNHLFQGLYAVLSRTGEAAHGRGPAALDRLRAVPAFLASLEATLDAPPAVFVDSALAMLGGGGELVVQTAATLGAEAPELRDDLTAAAGAALEALKRCGTALRDEIEPDADPHAFAIGEDQFARRLHFEHAIMAGAPELWRYGLHLQEEATARIVELAAELSPRPWRETVDELKNDAPPDDRLFETYRAELARGREFVAERNLVGLPDAPVELVATPPFLTSLVPFAAYEPPPVYLGPSRGRFYVTPPDPALPPEAAAQQRRGHCRHSIPAMVAHEAYPGHHLQLVTAQQLGSEVRRHLWTPVMVEGWALYCEQLAGETGFYRTPEERLFHQVNLLWRAIRIVLDVGLHTRGMTPVEAVDYMVEHLPIERRSAEAEVRRYCAWPTYQLCYAVGRREILSLREAYRSAVGEGFEARAFHDTLLGYGGMPVSLARWGMGLAE
jgi:uncharacterized protein (DUF885 family)